MQQTRENTPQRAQPTHTRQRRTIHTKSGQKTDLQNPRKHRHQFQDSCTLAKIKCGSETSSPPPSNPLCFIQNGHRATTQQLQTHIQQHVVGEAQMDKWERGHTAITFRIRGQFPKGKVFQKALVPLIQSHFVSSCRETVPQLCSNKLHHDAPRPITPSESCFTMAVLQGQGQALPHSTPPRVHVGSCNPPIPHHGT